VLFWNPRIAPTNAMLSFSAQLSVVEIGKSDEFRHTVAVFTAMVIEFSSLQAAVINVL